MFDINIFQNTSLVIGFFVFLFGITIGSFLNVAALRGLSGEDFVFARSKCPKCSYQLAWYDNIPILSYIFLLGHCRKCKCKISLQYPIVEFITGLLFVLAYLKFGLSIKALFVVFIACMSVLIAITDIKEKVVIESHVYILLILGFIYNFLGLGVGLFSSFLGAFLGYIVFEAIARLGWLITKNKTRIFGDGDSIIVAGLGSILGYKILIIAVILAILTDVIFIVPYMLYNKLKQKNYRQFIVLLTAIILSIALLCLSFTDIYKYSYSVFLILFISAILLWCAWDILMSVKNKEPEESSYLPFGPPLVISLLIVLFL